MNIGFVSTRLAGTDGVSLETAKLVTILRRMGHQPFYCAGELDLTSPPGIVVPEMHFAHPEARRMQRKAFPPSRQPGAAPDPGNFRGSFCHRHSVPPECARHTDAHPPGGGVD